MTEWQVRQKEEHEIDLVRVGKVIVKWSWLIAVVGLVFGIVSYLYSAFFIDPTYRASFTAYVNSRMTTEETGNVSVGELNASIGLAYAYCDIVTSRSVLTDAAQISGYGIPYRAFHDKVSIVVSETSAIITVSVEDTDPERATKLAAAIAQSAPEHVERVVDGGSLRILDAPVLPEGKYAPNNARNALYGAIIGCMLTAFIVVLRELVDDKVKSAQELESRYRIAIIGSIPDIHSKRNWEQYGYGKAGK